VVGSVTVLEPITITITNTAKLLNNGRSGSNTKGRTESLALREEADEGIDVVNLLEDITEFRSESSIGSELAEAVYAIVLGSGVKNASVLVGMFVAMTNFTVIEIGLTERLANSVEALETMSTTTEDIGGRDISISGTRETKVADIVGDLSIIVLSGLEEGTTHDGERTHNVTEEDSLTGLALLNLLGDVLQNLGVSVLNVAVLIDGQKRKVQHSVESESGSGELSHDAGVSVAVIASVGLERKSVDSEDGRSPLIDDDALPLGNVPATSSLEDSFITNNTLSLVETSETVVFTEEHNVEASNEEVLITSLITDTTGTRAERTTIVGGVGNRGKRESGVGTFNHETIDVRAKSIRNGLGRTVDGAEVQVRSNGVDGLENTVGIVYTDASTSEDGGLRGTSEGITSGRPDAELVEESAGVREAVLHGDTEVLGVVTSEGNRSLTNVVRNELTNNDSNHVQTARLGAETSLTLRTSDVQVGLLDLSGEETLRDGARIGAITRVGDSIGVDSRTGLADERNTCLSPRSVVQVVALAVDWAVLAVGAGLSKGSSNKDENEEETVLVHFCS